MRKLLLSIVCALAVFSLSAQLSENFSDYTAGGKLAQQAQAMGRNYWTTWSNAPGGNEDGVVADLSGNNAGHFTAPNNDQVLLLGGKTSGKWETTMKINIPTGTCGFFNILSSFAGGASEWALQVYFGVMGEAPNTLTPGIGTMHIAGSNSAAFSFAHDTWVNVRIFIDLDTDAAEIYINNELKYSWQYTLGTFGEGCLRVIDAMNFYPPVAGSTFYVDDIVFASADVTILNETSFDDVANGVFVAQSYPEFWTTWSNAPGGNEDAVISNEQSSSAPQSAKLAFAAGDDLVFKAGDKTTGSYTYDFEMYIPGTNPAFFNVLHIFGGSASEWAVGVYFNITSGSPANGSYVHHDGAVTNFTSPSNTWFPVSIFIDLDNDNATIDINGTQVLQWQYSIKENGGVGARQLAAVDFYPPEAGSVFYIDNVVYTAHGGDAVPIMSVNPSSEISKTLDYGNNTASQTVTVQNTGNSIGEYSSWVSFVDEGKGDGGKANFVLTYSDDDLLPEGGIGYAITNAGTAYLAVKFPLSYICDKVGTYITKLSYFVPSGGANHIDLSIRKSDLLGQPGEIIAQTSVSSVIHNYWNEADLAEPVLIDGQEIWAVASFIHELDAFPISCDGNVLVPDVNWFRLPNSSWSVFTAADRGNYMIKAFAEGDVIPACWLSLSGTTYGSIASSASKTFDVEFNSAGLNEGTYEATLMISTNDVDRPLFEIPCKLEITVLGVEEYTVNGVTTTIYPNPASDMITVQSTKTINDIQVINNIGQVVFSTKVSGEQTTINTSNLSSGMYIVRVSTDAGSKSIKVIIK